ncbi:MAG: rRNA adenine N-6-methyltransferase family protein, partial [Terriglobales bacterium]
GVSADEFVEFLKLCFGQKRKTLANNLKATYGEEAVRKALAAAGVRRDARAEALTLEQTAAVFRALRAG